jgi:hypothetical protein
MKGGQAKRKNTLLCTNKKQASDKQLQTANIIGRLFSDLLPYKISTVTVRRQLDF